MKNDLEDDLVKPRVLLTSNTFKASFKAALGFYVAQMLVTIFGLVSFGLTIFLLIKFFN